MTRRFSDIKDDIIIEQIKELNEGVYDPGIFKAFFLAGGPGSGKSYVQKKTTGGYHTRRYLFRQGSRNSW